MAETTEPTPRGPTLTRQRRRWPLVLAVLLVIIGLAVLNRRQLVWTALRWS